MKDAFRLAQKVDSKLLNNTINQSLTFAYYNVDDMQNAKCFLFKTLNDVETVIKSSLIPQHYYKYNFLST